MTFTNYLNRIAASGILHLGISDYSLVYVMRKVAIPNKNTHAVINVRKMKKFNVNGFKNDLIKLPRSNINSLGSLNDRLELWEKYFCL